MTGVGSVSAEGAIEKAPTGIGRDDDMDDEMDYRPADEEQDIYRDHLIADRIEESAMLAVRGLMSKDGSAWVDYQPGNLTSYKLVMTRFWLSKRLQAEHPQATKETAHGWGLNADGGYIMLAWMEHGAYPFRVLQKGSHVDPGYLQGKFAPRCQWGDAIALSALLDRMTALCAEYDFVQYPNGRMVAVARAKEPVA